MNPVVRKILMIWLSGISALCFGCGAVYSDVPAMPKYSTSWFGNSFSGATKHMQRTIDGMYVSPDGACYTNSSWDEGGHPGAIYKNGDFVGRLSGQQGRGYSFSRAITGDGTYIYYSMNLVTKIPDDPRSWLVARAFPDGRPAPWEGTKDPTALVLQAPKKPALEGAAGEIFGLAVAGRDLYVTTDTPDRVWVMDKDSGRPVRNFPAAHPGPLVVDRSGKLWIVERSPEPGNLKIVQYTVQGEPTGKVIENAGRPAGMSLDREGRLLVADAGPRQQIEIYNIAGARPVEAGVFGVRGGLLAGSPGRAESKKLAYPVAVGEDAAGALYVASRYPVTGCEIRAFLPDRELKWSLYSHEYMNCSDADPASDGETVYSPREVFALDFSKKPGLNGRLLGHTIDPFRFPDDPRLHGEGDKGYAPLLRRMDGRLFMYLIGERGRISIFRQLKDSLVFAPCAIYSQGPIRGDWPKSQPAKGRWIWRDKNGNGRIDADEIESDGVYMDAAWNLWIDSHGDIWTVIGATQVVHIPLEGFDGEHNPIYHIASAVNMGAPPPFPKQPFPDKLVHYITRMEYHPESDRMFLTGYTDGEYGIESARRTAALDILGPELFCYDNWRTSKRSLRWRVPLPFDAKSKAGGCNAMSAAGRFLFVAAVGGEGNQNKIWAYDVETGKQVGVLVPSAEVGTFGWIDFTLGIRSYQRRNGEILIFVEDVYKEKQVMYRLFTG